MSGRKELEHTEQPLFIRIDIIFNIKTLGLTFSSTFCTFKKTNTYFQTSVKFSPKSE